MTKLIFCLIFFVCLLEFETWSKIFIMQRWHFRYNSDSYLTMKTVLE